MNTVQLDLKTGLALQPADLLDLYRRRMPENPLLLKALSHAKNTKAPGPELSTPATLKERRETILAALGRGEKADAEVLAAGWLEAACQDTSGLELIAALEAFSACLETHGSLSESALALAAALRLHHLRTHLPFHGTLLRHVAGTLAALGAIDAARLVAAEALRLGIETEDRAGIAYSLCAAARMAAKAKDWPAALASNAAAFRFVPTGQNDLTFSLHQGRVNAFTALGRLEEAEREMVATAAVLAHFDSPLARGYLAWTAGCLHQAQGRHEEAAASLIEATKLTRTAMEPQGRILILLDLAASLETLGRKAELQERCAALIRELRPLDQLEGSPEVGKAFLALVRKPD